MKRIWLVFVGVLCTQTACDLQPKIMSFPDDVGEFISARYPALLADPNVNPEIYESAVTDYGVFASPDLYGTDVGDDYVMYASVDDYVIPPQDTDTPHMADDNAGSIKPGDADVSESDDVLDIPTYGGGFVQSVDVARTEEKNVHTDDVLQIKKPTSGVRAGVRVPMKNITVAAGDTLYSLSRKYSVPVNDLAVMNNLSAPFNLTIGQKLRVPDLQAKSQPQTAEVVKKDQKSSVQKNTAPSEKAMTEVPANKPGVSKVVKTEPKKISSNPKKKLPTIAARSSSKFAWPVRGNILSHYGAKSNGLFNDGINIAAARGKNVLAAENGVVAYAGNEVKGMGNLVIIQHSGGWMTVYAHMDSMVVRRGMRVTVGQKIGTVGKTGKVDTPQLHFEIRKGTKAYNPANYLKK
ncbi:MAG: M23 family metallopeptidase [Alphaproteobacteria bacterium]|nr:M23 family metallopeptidase [Alphaproteobacteria bacterium]